jgi:hypothetical protein
MPASAMPVTGTARVARSASRPGSPKAATITASAAPRAGAIAATARSATASEAGSVISGVPKDAVSPVTSALGPAASEAICTMLRVIAAEVFGLMRASFT